MGRWGLHIQYTETVPRVVYKAWKKGSRSTQFCWKDAGNHVAITHVLIRHLCIGFVILIFIDASDQVTIAHN